MDADRCSRPSAARLDAWARAIAEEHEHGQEFMHGAAARRIPDLAAAYRVQERLVEIWRARGRASIAGYKLGMTSPRMRAMCGIDEPIFGRLLDTGLLPSGAAVTRRPRLGIECEFAIRLGRDLPPHHDLDLGAVAAAVEAVCPAFEIIDDRGADYTRLDAIELVADNIWNVGVVLGEFAPIAGDLADLSARLLCDGAVIATGAGRDVAGHPLNPLPWLADAVSAHGQLLRAGQIILTGSLFAITFPERAARYRFEVAGHGAVEVEIRD